jgi:nitroimidazol reductase NimA-like FMN-containing flavoprotein (pyridoxamine 5'-phosphate oxidase superfamily)
MARGWVQPARSFGAKVIEEMSPEDCAAFLAKTTTVGRIAFLSSVGQQLMPVNFAFRNGCLYFATSAESVLAELATGCRDVVFEIDYPDRMTQHGWSVVARGETHAADTASAESAGGRLPHPWAPGKRDVLIEMVPREITGRRIRSDVAPPR